MGTQGDTKRSYYHNNRTSSPFVHETFFSLLDARRRKAPRGEAFVFYDSALQRSSFTFDDLAAKSLALAALLLDHYSIQPLDRIALVASNSPLVLITELAILRLGATVVYPPSGITGGDDLIKALVLTDCQGIICDMSYVESSTISFLHKCLPNLKFAVSFGKGSDQEGIAVDSFVGMAKGGDTEGGADRHDQDGIGVDSLMEITKGNSAEEDADRMDKVLTRQEEVNPDAPAFVFVTPGETGEPKAVVFSHFSLVNNVLCGLRDVLGAQEGDIVFVNHPFTHYGTQLYGVGFTCCVGTKTVTTDTSESVAKANTVNICQILEVEGCTMGLFYITMLHDLVNFPGIQRRADLSALRLAITSGQPLHNDKAEALRILLPKLKLCNVYGSTELGPGVATPARDPPPPPGYIGHVFPGAEAKVVDEHSVTLPANTLGELCLRGPYTSIGYMLDNHIQPLTDNYGWIHSGDYASMDSKGLIKVEGRKGKMIKRAAFKILPAQVERVILQNKRVRDVEVIGVPDERLHEEICACVIRSDPSLTEGELLEWCQGVFKPDTSSLSLAPKYVIFLSSDFPRGNSGEVDHKKLVELAINEIKQKR